MADPEGGIDGQPPGSRVPVTGDLAPRYPGKRPTIADMADNGALEEAWNAARDVLPAGWTIARPEYFPERRSWAVSARGPQPSKRGQAPEYVSGEGDDEAAAMRALAAKLRAR